MTYCDYFQELLCWKEPADEAADHMLRLKLDGLETKFQTITPPQTPASDPVTIQIYGRIQSEFATRTIPPPPPNTEVARRKLNWEDAYRLESEIACLLAGERLKQEIASRLVLATVDEIPNIAGFQAQWSALLKTFPDKIPDDVSRDFLLEILNAEHWQSRRKHTARKLRGQATRRTLLFGLMVLLAIILPLFFVRPSGTQARLAQMASLTPDVLEIASVELSRSLSNLPLCMALLFGFMGAIFSRLVTLQTQWNEMAFDELYRARTRSYIFLRATIGTVGALIVYVFLQSGLVKGNVFPTFDSSLTMIFVASSAPDGKWPTSILLPSSNLALLAMWCFIAGFSEKFVPTILSNTEQQFTGAVGRRQGT